MLKQQWIRVSVGLFMLTLLLGTAPAKTSAEDDIYDTLQILKFDELTKATDFSLTAVDGSQKKLSDFEGQVVLLNFWATWCMYCRSERASLQAVYDSYKDKGLTVVSVSIDRGSIDPVKAFVEENKLTFPNLHDPNNEAAAQYAVRAIPVTYFIDRQGNALGFAVGPRPWDSDDMKSLLTKLLTDSESSGGEAQEADAGSTEQAETISSATPNADDAETKK